MNSLPSDADRPALPDEAPTTEAELWQAFHLTRSSEAREAVFLHYLAHAKTITARVYARRQYDDIDFQDLYQLGCIGLLEAIDVFDPHREASFRTFSFARIEGNILNGISRLTDGQEQVFLRSRIKKDRLASLKDPAAGSTKKDAFSQLCDVATGMAIGFMLEDTRMWVSSDSAHGDMNAYRTAAWKQSQDKLRAQVDRLPANEKRVILYHYYYGLAFESIAAAMGLSKGRISQLHRSALNGLKKSLPPSAALSITR
ncbi:sigma-70 family RNA polymerase sigma factor [Pigmentiphaga sp. GD03639]|uniref:sigma-70 family RNA polymerase sigma factor n=1 Tax=Pigmentiphaga sp. GD03639 TaxID=2975354 RepID=UPI0024479214|nr:sigma-70 family RNA polymerase sigma factor [Pigmentiphaga sp. GD03639]MDH2239981.1 sigma-70 family RNA polymerase sigma factor [Pigmentiphaga sp. GD03639]